MSKAVYEEKNSDEEWYGKVSEAILYEAMNRGSTDNISVMMVGLNDPSVIR